MGPSKATPGRLLDRQLARLRTLRIGATNPAACRAIPGLACPEGQQAALCDAFAKEIGPRQRLFATKSTIFFRYW